MSWVPAWSRCSATVLTPLNPKKVDGVVVRLGDVPIESLSDLDADHRQHFGAAHSELTDDLVEFIHGWCEAGVVPDDDERGVLQIDQLVDQVLQSYLLVEPRRPIVQILPDNGAVAVSAL